MYGDGRSRSSVKHLCHVERVGEGKLWTGIQLMLRAPWKDALRHKTYRGAAYGITEKDGAVYDRRMSHGTD